MTQTVDILTQGKIKLATGVATEGSPTIASISLIAGNSAKYAVIGQGRNLLVHSTSGALAATKVWMARVLSDGISSITLTRNHPFPD